MSLPSAPPAAAPPLPHAAFLRNALILGLLTALGPFAIDMYLPALPAVGASLGADPQQALLSMTAFFASFALGHMVWGPLSDLVGRKPPLYAGIALFAGASVGCALAPDIHTLIALRLLQGLGGACGIVISRAIVRDLHSGVDEARLMSLLMLVMSVSPLLAPLSGSLVIDALGWRAVFWAVAVAAVAGLVLAVFQVQETRPPSARQGGGVGSVLRACGVLLRDREFLVCTFAGAFALAGFFVFLGNSSFVFMGHYGLTPMQFSLAFSMNAAVFFAAAQAVGWLAARLGLARILRPALWAYAAVLLVLLALASAGIDGFWVVMGLLACSYGLLGLIVPVSSVLALERHGEVAGTASSLMGTLQLATGGVTMAVAGALSTGQVWPMVASIAGCGVVAAALAAVPGGLPRP